MKQELQKSLPQDVRMWVFSGEQYELPSLDPFDTPFSVLFAEDAPKLLSSPDPDKPAESLETGKLFEDDMLDDSQITADDFMSDQPNSLDQNFMF